MDQDSTDMELAKIIGKNPPWPIRWGTALLFLIVVCGLLVLYRHLADL